MIKQAKRKMLALPYVIWIIGFTIIPLGLIAYYGLTTDDFTLTLSNVTAMALPEHIRAFSLALILSVLCTIICLLMAYPLAFILRDLGAKASSFIVFIFILPMWMNFLLRTMAWQTLLEKNGVINGILEFIGLAKIHIINTPAAIVLGMVYNFLPFMILPVYNTLVKIDNSVINAAHDLGANGFQTLTKIWLPLSVPGIISGVSMVFVPALTTFITSNLLGGGKILLIGNVIEEEFTIGSDWHLGAGLSLVLMIFILISMFVISKYDKDGEGGSF